MVSHAREGVLDGYDRGLPRSAAGLAITAVGDQGWQLHEHLDTPVATIRADLLSRNAHLMAQWCHARDAELWPHAKTAMSSQLLALQLDAGAGGMTAATAAQARLLLDWGAPRVLIANQVVQPREAHWLASTVSTGAQVICYVDSARGVDVLQQAAAATGTELEVLVEVGVAGGRTGVRDAGGLSEVLTALAARPGLRAVGVAGYEGSFGADRSAATLAAVDAFLLRQADVLQSLVASGTVRTDRPIYSAGGSMYFDRVEAARHRLPFDHRLILRSGCYLLHDSGLFERTSPLRSSLAPRGLQAALTIWGTVHSRPEPTRAYLDLGRRDVGTDQGLPRPLRRVRSGQSHAESFTAATATEINDQHLHLHIPAGSSLQIGDRIEFGISHPCTTMDKWRTLALVDGGGAVTGVVTTRF